MSGIMNTTGAVSGVIGKTSAPAIGTGTDGYVLTATGAGVDPAWEAAAGGGADATPAFRATTSGTVSVAASTYVIIPASVETWDSDSHYDTGAYKFTVPSGEGGKYLLMAGIGLQDPGNKKFLQISWYKNGGVIPLRVGQERHLTSADTVGDDHYMSATTLQELNAADYVQAYMYHNCGSSRNLYQDGTYFGGFKLAGV